MIRAPRPPAGAPVSRPADRLRTPRAAAATAAALLLAALPALAQDNGLIRGTVTDDTGAVIPGATATLLSDAIIGGTRSTVTNESGVFRFPALPAGDYAVEISLSGFDTVRYEAVRVGQNSTSVLDTTLSLSTVTEVVQVVAEAPLLDVSSNASITTFNTELVEELPTERNFYDYIHIAPGISQMNSGGGGDRAIAFGSNQQSNSWNIDGIESSAPETGSSWWDPNVDAIEEVEIIGIGAPAEFGNSTGGVFNIVTKKGGDTFSGAGNYFYQSNRLTFPEIYADAGTGEPVPEGTPNSFAFHRDNYNDITLTFGGPVVRERVWFMASGQYSRDSAWEAGNDPTSATADRGQNDKIGLKLTAKINDSNEIFVNTQLEDWASIGGSSPNIAASAAFVERGGNAAYTVGLNSVISDNTIFEARYAGWRASDIHDSPTGSFEMPFVNYDAEPTTTEEGGVVYPWDYRTWSNQFAAKVTHYADDFLGAQHEFRFGVQIAQGVAVTGVAAGPNSAYQYQDGGVVYQIVQEPYRYGGISRDNGFYVDDTVTVNDRLTLNLGLRLDINRGEIPAYELLASVDGESEFEAINAVAVEGNAPGDPDIVVWNLLSPRIGFTFRPDDAGRSAIKGFFGVHYDQNVIGNWDAPAPGATPYQKYHVNPDGSLGDQIFSIEAGDVTQPDNLLAPRSYHYTAAYEREIGNNMSVGVQYVHKYTDRMVGWSILGGAYETVQWADPYNGNPITLLSQVEQPTLVKGNTPGDFPGAPEKYEQTYDGILFTLAARDAGRWNLQGSYTYSRSVGLIPRPWPQSQNNPFYGNSHGQDPNAFLNLNDGQRLQGDRPHMLRLQGVVFLPWDLLLAANVNIESGKPYSRQIRAPGSLIEQQTQDMIVELAGSRPGLRQPTLNVVDLRLGKRLDIADVTLKLDAYLYNALNSTASIWMQSLRLDTPGEDFIPSSWVEPRRLMLLAGFIF